MAIIFGGDDCFNPEQTDTAIAITLTLPPQATQSLPPPPVATPLTTNVSPVGILITIILLGLLLPQLMALSAKLQTEEIRQDEQAKQPMVEKAEPKAAEGSPEWWKNYFTNLLGLLEEIAKAPGLSDANKAWIEWRKGLITRALKFIAIYEKGVTIYQPILKASDKLNKDQIIRICEAYNSLLFYDPWRDAPEYRAPGQHREHPKDKPEESITSRLDDESFATRTEMEFVEQAINLGYIDFLRFVKNKIGLLMIDVATFGMEFTPMGIATAIYKLFSGKHITGEDMPVLDYFFTSLGLVANLGLFKLPSSPGAFKKAPALKQYYDAKVAEATKKTQLAPTKNDAT